jgi:hypothetical protein
MIHYHGLPITPGHAAAEIMSGKHAFVSFAHNDQLEIALDICQSFALDNGAFSAWKSGKPITDWSNYYEWVEKYMHSPGFDFAVIPDVIDGDEIQNDNLIAEWPHEKALSAPVWHMHESIERFYHLCHNWPTVCIGSSGAFAQVGTVQWWARMGRALNEIVNEYGQPPCKLHGLRMLDPEVFSRLPLSSADSTNIGRNVGIDKNWSKGNYLPPDKTWRGKVMAARIESVNGAPAWLEMVQKDMFGDAA